MHSVSSREWWKVLAQGSSDLEILDREILSDITFELRLERRDQPAMNKKIWGERVPHKVPYIQYSLVWLSKRKGRPV